MVDDGRQVRIAFSGDNRDLTGEGKLARIFKDKALLVHVMKGYERGVADMLLDISVPSEYPYHPVYNAMAQTIAAGISQIEIDEACGLSDGCLVLLSPK